MVLFGWILALLLIAVLLTVLARQIAVPYPSLLALVGAGIAFLPFAPTIEIEPDLALALFVAPVLLDSAFDTSPRDLKRYAWPVTSLALIAVLITTAAVAFVGTTVAGIPLVAAIALGAIVAPPDAAAAAAVLGQLRPPRRIVAILQGESLLNDATALLIYRMAVIAATTTLVLANAAPIVVLSLIGSLIVGHVLARLFVFTTTRLVEPASMTVLQFVGTFGVWILAEHLGLSAIVTMVIFAITLARYAPQRTSARNRISSYSVWETAVFVLNVLAFVLMGLQARPILEHLSSEGRIDAFILAGLVLVTVIAVRFAWVHLSGTLTRLVTRWRSLPVNEAVDNARADVLISWCGMRGLVTLATAFALPADFPARSEIVLTAFCVVLGTLVIQGMTLTPLLRWLNLKDDGSLEREVSVGRQAVIRAALESFDDNASEIAMSLRVQYTSAHILAADPENPQAASEFDNLRLRAVEYQRQALIRLRADGIIGDEAFHRLEEEIDWSELDASPAGRFQPLTT